MPNWEVNLLNSEDGLLSSAVDILTSEIDVLNSEVDSTLYSTVHIQLYIHAYHERRLV